MPATNTVSSPAPKPSRPQSTGNFESNFLNVSVLKLPENLEENHGQSTYT
jgi:hypothetical protein